MMTTIIIETIAIILLLFVIGTMSFKIGYYEQTIENHKDKFTKERYKHFDEVKNKIINL